MFQEGLEEQITKAVVHTPGEVILFFGWWSCKKRLPLGSARDLGFSLRAPSMGWWDRSCWGNHKYCTRNCQAIVDAVVEKRTKTRNPGYLHWMMKVMRTPATPYDIEEWMWDMKEDASKVEARKCDAINHRPDPRNTHSQYTGQGSRWHRMQGRPQFLETHLVVYPLLGQGFQSRKQSKFLTFNHNSSVRRKQLTSTARKRS